jgi:hypothetical protein
MTSKHYDKIIVIAMKPAGLKTKYPKQRGVVSNRGFNLKYQKACSSWVLGKPQSSQKSFFAW